MEEKLEISSNLIPDDVSKQDVEILIPETLNWRAFFTTRDREPASRLTTFSFALNAFQPEQSLELFRKALGQGWKEEWGKGYEALANFLGHRPYGIRLAADSFFEYL